MWARKGAVLGIPGACTFPCSCSPCSPLDWCRMWNEHGTALIPVWNMCTGNSTPVFVFAPWIRYVADLPIHNQHVCTQPTASTGQFSYLVTGIVRVKFQYSVAGSAVKARNIRGKFWTQHFWPVWGKGWAGTFPCIYSPIIDCSCIMLNVGCSLASP